MLCSLTILPTGGSCGLVLFRDSDSRRASKDFWKAEIQNLEAASKAVSRSAARALKRELGKQLRSFKKGPNSNGSFQKAIRLKDKEAKGTLAPASFVSLGVPFMDVFEEGKTVTGKGSLIILLPPGEQLGFKRISKGNRWSDVWNRIKGKSRVVKASNGAVVLFKYQNQEYPIYKFQKSVKVPKKISFYETAEAIANKMPEEIERLLR
jgi:hypothetical protein